MIFKNKPLDFICLMKAWIFLHKHGFWDIHVHARDMNQWKKFTIAKWKKLAWQFGVRFGAFMPNTDPTITDKATLKKYIKIAQKSGHKNIKYKIWLGVTEEFEQIKEAVELCAKYPNYIMGLKIYAGTSTGNLGLPKIEQQRKVLEILVKLGYTGLTAFHCEEDGKMHLKKYDRENTESWDLARPETAETSSVEQVISLVEETSFSGHVHICHVSSHKSVIAINEAKNKGMNITCGVTIHHLIFDSEQISLMKPKKGRKLKCNPPIRSRSTRKWLLADLWEGLIDIVESDIAPHTKEDKENGASGVNNYKYLPKLIIELWKAGFSNERIVEVINKKPRKIFKLEDK